MLLFRSEEHVDRWCRRWSLSRGAILSMEQAWQLSEAWFAADRGASGWRRPPAAEVESLFDSLKLTGEFWRLVQTPRAASGTAPHLL
jgi:hypothetical protein